MEKQVQMSLENPPEKDDEKEERRKTSESKKGILGKKGK